MADPANPKHEPPLPITKDHLVLVEGGDDEALLRRATEGLAWATELEIRNVLGKDKYAEAIKALVLVSGWARLKSLTVITDADDSPDSGFQSCCHALRKNGLPVPVRPAQPSVEPVRERYPCTMVIMIHGTDGTGELEDLCLPLLKSSELVECAESAIACAEASGIDFAPKRQKALFNAAVVLASKNKQRSGMVTHAVARELLNPDGPALKPILDALRSAIAPE